MQLPKKWRKFWLSNREHDTT